MQHKNILQRAKGFRGRAKNCYSFANERVAKSLTYSYRDRRTKRRFFRSLAIQRINSTLRYNVPHLRSTAESNTTLNYSRFIKNMATANIKVNRHILSNLAVTEPLTFKAILKCCANGFLR